MELSEFVFWAKAAVAALAASFAEDDHVAPMLLSSPAVLGVAHMDDDRVAIRVTAPSQVGRREEVYRAWRLAVLRAYERGELLAPSPAPSVLIRDAHGPAASVEAPPPTE